MRKIRNTTISMRWVSVIILTISMVSSVYAQPVPAFPGAEGYGAQATGGRGGRVIAVTNLNDSGPGSLQAACEAEGPRIVVFKVGGAIDGDVDIEHDNITIAGQTAPGYGITIKGGLGIGADNVVIRYIRVRGDEAAGDAMGSRGHKNIIVDHVSTSWSTDELLSIYICENVTIQWSMMAEALNPEGHAFGGIWGNNSSTYHHNLFAHNISRNPRFGSGTSPNDFRNNVIYNWVSDTIYGGENYRNEKFPVFTVNIVANYFKPGPATEPEQRTKIAEPWRDSEEEGFGKWYVADNYVVGSREVTNDNWKGVFPEDEDHEPQPIKKVKLNEPVPTMPITQQSAQEAYQAVLDHVGAALPKRDAVDKRIIEEVRNGTATFGNNGIIDSQEDVGDWPELESGTAPTDSDSDGMPDEWEKKYGLNPNDAADNAQDKDGDGYTNVEEYLNGTDPTEFVDYTKPENNVNTLH